MRGDECFESDRIRVGVAFSQGQQSCMQDRFSVDLDEDHPSQSGIDFVGISDGMGCHGETIALFVAANINDLVRTAYRGDCAVAGQRSGSNLRGSLWTISQCPSRPTAKSLWQRNRPRQFLEAIEEGCLNLDEKLREVALGMDCTGQIFNSAGATFCGMWTGNLQTYCCNVGDCRIIMSYRGTAVAITEDHCPSHPTEKERIRKAGGLVANNQINGILSASRAFGLFSFKSNVFDKRLKQCVIAQPDIYVLDPDVNVDFIILASSGLWKMLTNQQAVDFVCSNLRNNLPLNVIASLLMDFCEESPDNLTCAIVSLRTIKPCLAKLIRRPVRTIRS